jgi:hypothetical protein
MIGLLVDEAAPARRVRRGILCLFSAFLALGIPACSDLAEPGAEYDGAAAGGLGDDSDVGTGDGSDGGTWGESGAEGDDGATGDDGGEGDGTGADTTDGAGPSSDDGTGDDGTDSGGTADGTGGADTDTSTWDSETGDPCAGLELPPCPEPCTAEHGDCGEPCGEGYADGYTCGDELGNGMICEGGEWVCVTADPPQPGACDVVCEP